MKMSLNLWENIKILISSARIVKLHKYFPTLSLTSFSSDSEFGDFSSWPFTTCNSQQFIRDSRCDKVRQYWTIPFKSTGGVTRDPFYLLDISAATEFFPWHLENFGIWTENFAFFAFLFIFTGNLGPLGGSTEAQVMRDIDQSSWSTGGCVMHDCRFERNCPVSLYFTRICIAVIEINQYVAGLA
jgi:hypothetical protein